MNPCPAQELLQRLLTEELPPLERSPLEAHVEECLYCQQSLEQLVADSQMPLSAAVDASALTPLLKLRRPQAEAAEPRTQDPGRTVASAAPAAAKSLAVDFLAPTARPDSLGRLGHYEVLEVLGRGGFGIVFRAFDDVLQRVVAIKVLAAELAATSPARKRFLREARAAAQVCHKNVVLIHAVEEQPLPYLVMEFIPGETLQQRLDRVGPLEPAEVVAVGCQVADGLAAAHAAGLIHRDVKPANVLLETGPRLRVKITDFGLARAADDASLTQSGVVAGTPMYMSPEQARGEKLDHRTDLFSLGSLLYAITSGRPPFRAENTLTILKRVAEDTPRPIPEVIPETPDWLCRVIAKLMVKDPGQRFQTAAGAAEALEAGLSPAGRQAAPSSSWRSRRMVALAAGVLALAAILAAVPYLTPPGADPVNGPVEHDPAGVVAQTFGGKPTTPEKPTDKDEKPLVNVGPSQNPPASADQDRKAAAWVLSIGGVVKVNHEGRHITAVAELPEGPFTLTGIDLLGRKMVTDAGLACLQGCTGLTHLVLNATSVTDVGLAHVSNCKGLKSIELGGTKITGAGLACFEGCQQLQNLNLEVTGVTNADLALCRSFTGLKSLNLYNTAVTDAGLAHFKDCKDLTSFNLGRTNITDAGLALFNNHKDWGYLILHDTAVTDEGLKLFRNSKKMKVLHLENTAVTDAGLANFRDCTQMQGLVVKRTKVTAMWLEEFHAAAPGCKIEYEGGVIGSRQ